MKVTETDISHIVEPDTLVNVGKFPTASVNESLVTRNTPQHVGRFTPSMALEWKP